MDPRLHLPFMHPGEKGARLIPAGSIEASPAKHDARPGSRGHRAGAVERSSDEKGEAGDDVRSCFPVTAAGPLPSGQSLNGSTVLADVALLLSHRNHEPSGSGCVNGSVNETGQNRLRQTRRARPLATTEHLSAHLSEHGEDVNAEARYPSRRRSRTPAGRALPVRLPQRPAFRRIEQPRVRRLTGAPPIHDRHQVLDKRNSPSPLVLQRVHVQGAT
jgi:hypothetical protein